MYIVQLHAGHQSVMSVLKLRSHSVLATGCCVLSENEEQGGAFKGRLEVSAEFARIMQSPATTLTPNDENGSNESLWNEKWNEVIWGPQLEMDQMESQAYSQAKSEARAGGRGTMYGAGESTGPRPCSTIPIFLRLQH